MAHRITSSGGDAQILHVELELGRIAAMRQHQNAVVVAHEQTHARGVRLGDHLAGAVELAPDRLQLGGRRDRHLAAVVEQQLDQVEARAQEGAVLEHRLDALGVRGVAVIDDVDAFAHALEDQVAPRAVRAHAHAAVVRRGDDHAQLVGREAARAGVLHHAVAAAREDLDDPNAALDLLADRLAELVGAVAEALRAEVGQPPPVLCRVVVVAGGVERDAAGQKTRAVHDALFDRERELGVDVVVHDARRDDAREARVQRAPRVVRGDQHQVAGRLLDAERLGHDRDVAVGGVVVGEDQPRQERPAGEVDDAVARRRRAGGASPGPATEAIRSPSTTTVTPARAGALAVEQVRVREDRAAHAAASAVQSNAASSSSCFARTFSMWASRTCSKPRMCSGRLAISTAMSRLRSPSFASSRSSVAS